MFGFNHSNSVVKTKIFYTGPTYLNVNYLSQQHAKLLENSSDFNNFIQCLISGKVFGSLTQNCVQLAVQGKVWCPDTFSLFLVDKYAVITTQKSSYVECFSFGQQRFVLAHLAYFLF